MIDCKYYPGNIHDMQEKNVKQNLKKAKCPTQKRDNFDSEHTKQLTKIHSPWASPKISINLGIVIS